MERFLWIALGVMLLPSSGLAQTPATSPAATEISGPSDTFVTAAAVEIEAIAPEFVPMTRSERARKYLLGAFGPGAILRAAAAGGLAQSSASPKEWGGGASAYGERVGNVFAKHVIRESLEFGASTALREDNRYIRSTDSGWFKRSRHVVVSVFTARNEAGGEHFAYSRFGGVLGSSFIARVWQPRSRNTTGDAATSFGLTMASDLGWNFFREFVPRSLLQRFTRH
jgi:hypothetical protein